MTFPFVCARTCRYCAALLAFVLLLGIAAPVRAGTSPSRVVVGWQDVSSNKGLVRSFPATAPWAFDTSAMEVGGNPTLRAAGRTLYALGRFDGTVIVIRRRASLPCSS